MSWTGQEVVLFILGQLVVGAAIWGGIRAEIKNMHERIKSANDRVDYAHERIDTILGWNGKERRDHERRGLDD